VTKQLAEKTITSLDNIKDLKEYRENLSKSIKVENPKNDTDASGAIELAKEKFLLQKDVYKLLSKYIPDDAKTGEIGMSKYPQIYKVFKLLGDPINNYHTSGELKSIRESIA